MHNAMSEGALMRSSGSFIGRRGRRRSQETAALQIFLWIMRNVWLS